MKVEVKGRRSRYRESPTFSIARVVADGLVAVVNGFLILSNAGEGCSSVAVKDGVGGVEPDCTGRWEVSFCR